MEINTNKCKVIDIGKKNKTFYKIYKEQMVGVIK